MEWNHDLSMRLSIWKLEINIITLVSDHNAVFYYLWLFEAKDQTNSRVQIMTSGVILHNRMKENIVFPPQGINVFCQTFNSKAPYKTISSLFFQFGND